MTKYAFKTIAEIEEFLEKAESGEFDNIWENITDEYGYDDDQTCIAEFNKALNEEH
jgi:hypothetical protein